MTSIIFGYDINNPEEKEKLAQVLQDRMQKEHMGIKDALEITDEMMEYLYQLGYYFYNTGQFTKALDAFRHLTMLDNKSYRYAFGMGATCHQLKQYDAALTAYCVAFLDDVANPTPLYYAADCLIELGELETADKFCIVAINLSADNPAYSALQENSKLLHEGLQAKLSHKTAKAA